MGVRQCDSFVSHSVLFLFYHLADYFLITTPKSQIVLFVLYYISDHFPVCPFCVYFLFKPECCVQQNLTLAVKLLTRRTRKSREQSCRGREVWKKEEKTQTALIWNIHSLPSALKNHKLSPLEKRRGGGKNTNKPQTKHLLIRLRHCCKAILCSHIIINFFFVLKL